MGTPSAEVATNPVATTIGAEPSSSSPIVTDPSSETMLTPSFRPSPFHQSSILFAESTHNGTTPPVDDALPLSPSPEFELDLTISTSRASNQAVLTPLCFKYA